jgi:hypothetical protein
MLRSTMLAATFCLPILGALAVPATADNSQGWSDISAGTAMAYCLAKHTGVKAGPDGYSADGFELAQSGIIGSVRRNFVLNRPMQAPGSSDAGAQQTCSQACAQLGGLYGPSLEGVVLKYRAEGTEPVASGIGDHASLAMRDYDFNLGETVVSGFWTRPQNYQNEDVAQADHCCCQAVDAKQDAK